MNRSRRDPRPPVYLTSEEIEECCMLPPDSSDDDSADDSDADPDYDPDLAHTNRLERFMQSKYNNEVEKRPPLYDVQSKEYSNRNVKAQCWMEVGAAVHDNWEEMTPQMKDEAGN
ncbi:hypothetical protein J6590_096080 [Homalodisca vitripennis]|nr:hypothetical protein J6590_096080 [Homalodisca vitripennis]